MLNAEKGAAKGRDKYNKYDKYDNRRHEEEEEVVLQRAADPDVDGEENLTVKEWLDIHALGYVCVYTHTHTHTQHTHNTHTCSTHTHTHTHT